MNKITIITPDDWHLHLRDSIQMAAVVGDSARQFEDALSRCASGLGHQDRELVAVEPSEHVEVSKMGAQCLGEAPNHPPDMCSAGFGIELLSILESANAERQRILAARSARRLLGHRREPQRGQRLRVLGQRWVLQPGQRPLLLGQRRPAQHGQRLRVLRERWAG